MAVVFVRQCPAVAVPAAVGVLAFVAARDRRDSSVRLDLPGALAVCGGLFCLVYGLSNAETHGWSAALWIGMSLVAAAALLAIFVIIESQVPSSPLLPLRIVADRNRTGSYLAIGIAFCSMFSAFLFLSYYLQQSLGYSSLKTGSCVPSPCRRYRRRCRGIQRRIGPQTGSQTDHSGRDAHCRGGHVVAREADSRIDIRP